MKEVGGGRDLPWFTSYNLCYFEIHYGMVNMIFCFWDVEIFSKLSYSNECLSIPVGVYADNDDVNESLGEKYGNLPASELQEKDFDKDVMEGDICMTVRLQIVYGKLSIRSVRSAFEESVGNRLQKFGGPDNKELLHKWVISWLKEVIICLVSMSWKSHTLYTLLLLNPYSLFLCRFTSQFKDEYKIPRGSVIDLSKERGHVLRTISEIPIPF